MTSLIRRAILAIALIAGFSPAFAQAPGPVPALPDAERRISYSLSASTCACSINFAIFGEGVDYQNWIEVFVNGTLMPQFGNWTITSPTGPIANLPRPITDAVLTFNTAQTGIIQIVGARRPRRISQFSESGGVSARNLNQTFTDIIAMLRENWDKTNDVTGRAILAPPGETLRLLTAANVRASSVLGFDAIGNLTTYTPASGVTSSANVTFLQLGLGAVPRTVQDELRATVSAAQFGAKCDGVTDDAPWVQNAVNFADTIGNPTVVLPAGTCRFNSNVFLNKFTTTSALTAPGLNIRGQGKGVTTIDSRVANGYAFSINPDWKAAHQSQFSIAGVTGGSGALATNTYYLKVTVNDNSGNEVYVTTARPVAVTGPTGRIAITLQALNNGYSYNLYCGTTTSPANYCIVNGSDTSAIGGGQSVNIDAIGTAHTIPLTKIAVWQQVNISDLSITSTTNAANASGVLLFKAGYSNITNVYMHHLLGSGLDMPNYSGDNDGSFVVTVDKSKFDTIAGWCVNAAGNTLELSNFTVINSVFNICGTPPANLNTNFTIASITNAATPVVTTSAPHTLQKNDQIRISGVAGMTLATDWYRACGTVASTTFNLCDLNGQSINTTSLGSYTASSGTESLSWRPPTVSGGIVNGSGGMSWTGLIGTFKNLGFTQNNNVAMYFSEAGSSDNPSMEGIDFENTAGKGLYIASLLGGTLTNSECLSTSGIGNTISCVQLGTGFAGGSVLNFKIRNIKVRSDVTPMVGFEQFQNTNLNSTFVDTNRVSHIYWQAFDGAGQTRFNGFTFDPIPGQASFIISGTNVAKLLPRGYGGCLPIHLKANGEWICVRVPDLGVTQGGIGGLSANTSYNFYAYNSATTAQPIAVAMEVSSAGPVLDQGYFVKSGDASRTFVGQATTDGSGNFQAAGVQLSQYPIQVSPPLSFATGALGCPSCVLISGTAHGDSAYAILSTDRYVYTSAAFTAPRTWTLPAANSLPVGTTVWVQDAQNTVTSTNTLTIARAGADTINVSGTSLIITGAGGGITFTTDGVSNWGVPVQTVSTGGTGRQTLTNHGVLVGAAGNPVTMLAVGSNGQLMLGATGADPAFATMSQDCTITAAGVTTCTKTNNVAFTGPATAAYAAKTDMQTPSSSTLVVNPRDVQDHPGAAKFHGKLDGKTGATCTVTGGYNIASCSRGGVGTYTVNFTTNFANTAYTVTGNANNAGVATGIISPSTAAVGSYQFFCLALGTGAAQDCDVINIVGFGTQ